MAFSKIIVNGTTNMDVTQTTATASDVLYGKTLVVADGTTATGTLQVVTYHTSTSAPTSSQGNNGDIWLVTA